VKRIIAKPLAGLANKLRVIESVVSLAKDLQAPVEIVWVPDVQMVAHYHDLFEESDLFNIIKENKYNYSRSSFSLKGYKKTLGHLFNAFYGIDKSFNDQDIAHQVRPGNWDIVTLAKNRTIYIDTCHNFYNYHYNFSWVKPLPPIANAIDDFAGKIRNKSCIGLHIRRTDNEKSIAESPDQLFEQAISQEIAKDPNIIFFLATDNAATEQHFLNLFGPERILVYKKRFGRESIDAIRDAVVDWMLLGKCSKLYCSYWSSFSETAAAVANTKAIVCRISQNNNQ
jgi:hypothetical protein